MIIVTLPPEFLLLPLLHYKLQPHSTEPTPFKLFLHEAALSLAFLPLLR
jgi:hypothetical protein